MDIALVVAIARNGIIGNQGGLPWRLPTDLRHFRAVTLGKPVIMGRRTWESIGRPLAGRVNIVVTRDEGSHAPGTDVVNSLKDAFQLAQVRGRSLGTPVETCVIGGGEIYAQALPKADRLYVTHVLADCEGDTRFPPIDEAEWQPVSREAPPRGNEDTADMLFVTYERQPGQR